MTPSKKVIGIIKEFEGLSLKPYLCPARIPTIGYGSTYYENGIAVKLTDDPITEERAESLLLFTLTKYSNAVNKLVKVKINQNQFDALVDFAYNAGIGALQNSTLLKKLNAEDYEGASIEFGKWVKGGGRILPGLVRRRAMETKLFNEVTNA